MGLILPSEYQEVEYLESTGSQYINLGLNSSMANGCFSIKAMIASNTPINTQFIGCNTDNRNKLPKISIESVSSTFNARQATNIGAGLCQKDSVFVMRIDRSGDIYVDDVKRGTLSGTVSHTGRSYYLFCAIPGSASSYGAKARIYFFNIWDDEKQFVDLIPCYRKSDDKPGMYDLVSDTFFTNAGTGEFVVGHDVIDSISPWMVARRRMLIGGQNKLILYANGNEHTAITGGWDLIRNNNATLTKTASGMTLYANNSQVGSAIGMASFNPALLAKYKKVCVRVSAFLKLVTAGDTYLQIRSEPVWNATVLASTPIKNAGVIELDISAISNGYVIIPFYRVEYTISRIWLEK